MRTLSNLQIVRNFKTIRIIIIFLSEKQLWNKNVKKNHMNRDSHITFSPISQSSFFEEVFFLILASSRKKLREYIKLLKFDVLVKKNLIQIRLKI